MVKSGVTFDFHTKINDSEYTQLGSLSAVSARATFRHSGVCGSWSFPHTEFISPNLVCLTPPIVYWLRPTAYEAQLSSKFAHRAFADNEPTHAL